MGVYDHGFDRDALVNNDTIKKLTKIVTLKAGLRNGDIVVRYDFPNR
ncbi:MAG: hypothetical protein O7C59_09420 [Rickettsia endosymbiont of Ixodes persulcatus]|nr:hypothetical protein [Rickettsia endosymbiont of Ixodes persulcatus]MCZ6903598.1 hypothetical protein [Rickettsia endosymbiont of Ixodes persulcatus]MCZ6909471.1 hypothetical protein [Rickettsia endosymbiont of Ixodes persulcatus]MCZ6911089.1 hypothetical protein [Rickettsia endosymbiont of Ixodes persulcatus]MCZ6914644.1 hypothetical protein [Rickettsia endosymbiont of Ixodes persulcatus]